MPTPAEMKKALLQAGFTIYRTRGDVVHLAERVRENLLMDSAVFVHAPSAAVGFVARAQKSDFPSETDAQILERARALATDALARGYTEVSTLVRDVHDPGDAARTIDAWLEVSFEKPLGDVEAVVDEVRFAFSIEKTVAPR